MDSDGIYIGTRADSFAQGEHLFLTLQVMVDVDTGGDFDLRRDPQVLAGSNDRVVKEPEQVRFFVTHNVLEQRKSSPKIGRASVRTDKLVYQFLPVELQSLRHLVCRLL